jgi:hypothetical protein
MISTIKNQPGYDLKEVCSSGVSHVVLSKVGTNVSEEPLLPIIKLKRGCKKQVTSNYTVSHQEREFWFFSYFFKSFEIVTFKTMHTYTLRITFTLYIILSMILQLSGLVNLIVGSIIAATTQGRNLVLPRENSGKFDFWYQWRNYKLPAIFWRNLRKEVHKNLSFLTPTQDDITGQIPSRQLHYQTTACILWEGVCLGPIPSQDALLNRKLLTPATNQTTICCYFNP